MDKTEKKSRKRKLKTDASTKHQRPDINERYIVTEDQSIFQVDENIMSRESDYFKLLFHYNSQPKVIVKEISGHTMKSVIRFIQTKAVTVNAENISALLKASDFFKLDRLLQIVRYSLPEHISDQNCIKLYGIALDLEHLDIFKLIRLYVQVHFPSVVNSNIGDLSFKYFEELLYDSNLNIQNEEIVWDAIVKWVKHDEDSRYKLVPSLLRCIRLESCDDSFVQKMVAHPVIQKNEFCSDILAQIESENGSIKENFIEKIRSLSSVRLDLGPRKPLKLRIMMVHINYKPGSNNAAEKTEMSIECVEDETNTIRLDTESDFLPKFLSSYGTSIYMFDVRGRYIAFDLLKGARIPIPEPPQGFHYISFSLVHGQIFASLLHGRSPLYAVSTAVFNPQASGWSLVGSPFLINLSGNIYCFEAADLKESIYIAVRASITEKYTESGIVYNTKTNAWSTFALPHDDLPDHTKAPNSDSSRPKEKRLFSMVSHMGSLYFFENARQSVYEYCADSGMWGNLKVTPYKYEVPIAVVHSDMLSIYEGKSTKYPFSDLHWDTRLALWKNQHDPPDLACIVHDENVLWKYFSEIRKREWRTAAETWEWKDF